jgi:hypothetical protein
LGEGLEVGALLQVAGDQKFVAVDHSDLLGVEGEELVPRSLLP